MEIFKLWLEPDKQIPRFKRLAYEVVDVSLADVLTKGIHPLQAENTNKTLGDRFVQILNSDDLKLEEMSRANYCKDTSPAGCYTYYYNTSPFVQTLEQIKNDILFVEDLSYMELIL